MRPRRTGTALHVAALLGLLTCTTALAAGQERQLVSVADYLSALADSYEPTGYDAALLHDAETALQQAASALAPNVTFEQSLAWDAYSTLSLELDSSLRLPLYDSRARSNQALAAVDLAAARSTLAAALAGSRLALFVDLATYAALSEAAAGLAPLLQRLDAAPWLSDPTLDRVSVAPAERGLYEAHLRLIAMHGFLTDQLTEVELRLARLLDVAAERLRAPSTAAVRAALPSQPDDGTCLATAPAVAAARLRHRQRSLAAALDATPPVTLALTSDLTAALGTTGSAAGSPAAWSTTATVVLEARVGLAPGRGSWRDVDGALTATASPAGASQSLRISWPRPQHATFVEPDPDAALADELRDVAVDLRTLRRAVEQAVSERARLQRSLDWLLLDNGLWAPSPQRTANAGPMSPTDTPIVALPPDVPPGLAVQVADLGAQLAFAGLDEVSASAQLAAACGAWP